MAVIGERVWLCQTMPASRPCFLSRRGWRARLIRCTSYVRTCVIDAQIMHALCYNILKQDVRICETGNLIEYQNKMLYLQDWQPDHFTRTCMIRGGGGNITKGSQITSDTSPLHGGPHIPRDVGLWGGGVGWGEAILLLHQYR